MKQAAIVILRPKALTAVGLAVLSWGVLAGVVKTVFDEPTLGPGDTVICVNNPCTVYFETPTGTGTHDIIAEGEALKAVKAGVAIGGQRVSLGGYYPGDTVFIVQGTDLPNAYLTVLDGM